MNIEELRDYCLSVRGAEESFPFGYDVLVFKVMGKMFAYIGIEPKDGMLSVNLKCDPERSEHLRERYAGVSRGHYGNTLLWNAVTLESDVPDALIRELIEHSVEEVVKSLPRAKRQEYLDGGSD